MLNLRQNVYKNIKKMEIYAMKLTNSYKMM